MPFAPGQSGNPGGVLERKLFRNAVVASLKKVEGNVERIQRVADKVVDMAINGNMHALEFIADRVDGKVPQPIAANITSEVHEHWIERLGGSLAGRGDPEGATTIDGELAAVRGELSADSDQGAADSAVEIQPGAEIHSREAGSSEGVDW